MSTTETAIHQIAIVDSQFYSGRGNDLTEALPDDILKRTLKVGSKNLPVEDFFHGKTDGVVLIVVHASGVADLDRKLLRLTEIYNGADPKRMLTPNGVPIVVVSGDFRLLAGPSSQGYLGWLRAEWRDRSRAARNVEEVVHTVRSAYGGFAALRDAHDIWRSLYALIWRLSDPGAAWPTECGAFTCADAGSLDERIRELTSAVQTGVCFGLSGLRRSCVDPAIAAVNRGTVLQDKDNYCQGNDASGKLKELGRAFSAHLVRKLEAAR